MRVTGGALRGRRLLTPTGMEVRPTSDRVREALFQIIGAGLGGARMADLFAGSGALGIEGLSRGADFCLFVEQSRRVAAILQRNLQELALTDRSRVVIGPLERRLGILARSEPAALDWIFLDPPYRRPGIPDLLPRLAVLLAPGGRLVWEHQRGAAEVPPGLRMVDQRSYGQTGLSILAAGD